MKGAIPLLVALGAVAVLLGGCETETPSEAYITVTPREAIISKGESIEFVASGWHAYVWQLSDTSLGYLSAPVGERTIYTSRVAGSATQILTVSGQADTNTGSTAISAEAYITHL
jgi:hypothetical protein